MPGNSDYAAWRSRLAQANDPAFWPMHVMDRMLVDGEAQFWCDGESAVVTRLMTFPGGAIVVEGIAAYGNSESIWNRIVPMIEEFGVQNGAKCMHAMGRIGWDRASRPHGWKREMVLIAKDLA